LPPEIVTRSPSTLTVDAGKTQIDWLVTEWRCWCASNQRGSRAKRRRIGLTLLS
jgi:hypothetical protein